MGVHFEPSSALELLIKTTDFQTKWRNTDAYVLRDILALWHRTLVGIDGDVRKVFVSRLDGTRVELTCRSTDHLEKLFDKVRRTFGLGKKPKSRARRSLKLVYDEQVLDEWTHSEWSVNYACIVDR